MGFDIAPRVESWDDTPDLFQLHVYGPHNSYIQAGRSMGG